METPRLSLSSPVSSIPSVGSQSAARLGRLGIKTVKDLLYYLPFRYDDFSLVAKIAGLQEGEVVTIQGIIRSFKNLYTRGRYVLQKALVEDQTGSIEVTWFNQPFLLQSLRIGAKISLSGRIKRNGRKLALSSPQYEVLTSDQTTHTGRLVPVYSESAGLTNKWLRGKIKYLVDKVKDNELEITEPLDESITDSNQLIGLRVALISVHFPQDLAQAEAARRRLAFDELLLAQLQAIFRKRDWQKKVVGNKFKITEVRDRLKVFVDNLPFELTRAQKRVIDQIYKDLARQTPMNRLLQGDVGSGKTVVAALAMLAAYLNGYSSVLMAPTEILANQHYQTVSRLLSPLEIGVGIATGARKDYTGFDVVVGTHALISDKLNFSKLGLVVIDEQHRFGVEQRAKITGKGINPHVLTMTATPIPRTVALTLYGDLDMSILDQMPKGRIPVKTWVVPKEKREAAYDWIRKQNSQAFIICPLIEQSETLTAIKAVKVEFERLTKEVFPELKLGLLHGRLSSKEKDKAISDFRSDKLDILVATPVVEVGIDIPAASIMVIEGAERFGLAQLHQLRGRVGRSDQQSYCLLFTSIESYPLIRRLKYLETLHDGLELAEIDLKFRGPGERFGTAQHGRWDLNIATFDDSALLEKTLTLAEKIVSSPEMYASLLRLLEQAKIEQIARN